MPDCYDLHSHSTVSDGALSPSDLIKRAAEKGVNVLALTDHDTVAGLAQARASAEQYNLQLINGIELSVTWQMRCFHIVGLNIDANYQPLMTLSEQLQQTRYDRAFKIAEKLEKKRIMGAWDAVIKAAGDGMITRTHFADFLVAQGYVRTQQEAFDYYLAKGKPAYVGTTWVDLAQAIAWINEAGGIAVLAHPMRYSLSPKWMRWLLTEFKTMGGKAIEVITSRMNPDELRLITNYAQQFELAGSVGSDFHNPDNQWVELGRLLPLPQNIKPVWELF
jgi:predicted metal-dependent phosphoesterase TrpH